MPAQKYIRRADVPDVYGASPRQVKRWLSEGHISCKHPRGKRGPCFIPVADLDALFDPPKKTKRKKPAKKRAS